MPRLPRTVFDGIPHHVTQRGNRREDIFFTDEDRMHGVSSHIPTKCWNVRTAPNTRAQQFTAIRASDDLGWQSYFSQPITVTEVPGDHLTMMHVSNAEALAATLAAFLAEPS